MSVGSLPCTHCHHPSYNLLSLVGLSLAFAIAEHLLSSKACTLFVTHYPQITSLATMYGNAKNVHLKTAIDSTGGPSAIHGGSGASIKYLREVGAGPCDLRSGYGILMAEQCGFPSAVLLDARELRTVIRDKFPVLIGGGGVETSSEEEQSLGSLTTLLQHLSLLKTHTQLDDHAVRTSLSKLRAAIPDCTATAIIAWLATLASTAPQKKPLDEVTPVRSNRAGQDLSAEMM